MSTHPSKSTSTHSSTLKSAKQAPNKTPGPDSPGDEFTLDHHVAGTTRPPRLDRSRGITPDQTSDDAALGRAFNRAHLGAESARDRAYDAVVHAQTNHDSDETAPEGPISDGDSDDEEIFAQTGHIPDRDQSFGVDHKEFPGTASPGAEYEGDYEEQIKGERDFTTDALDDLAKVGHLSRPVARPPSRSPTPAPMADNLGSELDGLTDEELVSRARALGIPGRAQMSRTQLAQAVHEAAHHV